MDIFNDLFGDSKMKFGNREVTLPKSIYEKLSDSEKQDLRNHNASIRAKKTKKKALSKMANQIGYQIGKSMKSGMRSSNSRRRRRY